jgi:serine/threonine-protein kinase
MIEFRALGTLGLRTPDGQDIRTVLAQPKRVALLAYLAAARPRGFHRRDTLLALLWPEQDAQHARWALNQALRHLRDALGKQIVVSRGDGEVGIDAGCLVCDVVQFETAIEAGELERALELYRGDFLEGFHIAGGAEFEHWLEEERAWLRQRAAHAASALARRLGVTEPATAAHWARRALALSPDDEAEARRLIELLSRSGDRAGAIQTYEAFARRLREEYEVEPAPETQALMAAVRSRQRPPVVVSRGAEEPPAVDSLTVDTLSDTGSLVQALEAQSRRPRRTFLTLSSILLAVGGAFVLSPNVPGPAPAAAHASSNTVAVFPFAYRGGSTFAYLGDGMMDLLSASLDGAGDIRTVDPHNVLASIAHAGEKEGGSQRARQASARLQAGSYVLGDVVEAGSRLRISARLYTVGPPDQMPVSVSVEGAPAQLLPLVDGLTARLIAGRSGGPAGSLTRLAALTTDSLSALKAYLEGERHFRAGRLDLAFPALERAIQIDSTFALASYRIATAEMWNAPQRPRAAEAVDRALRFGHRLSRRDRRLMEALAASLDGRVADAERTYREIVSRYPDDLEANYQLGELISHWSSIIGRSWLDARAPYERVLSIDPDHEDALFHLSAMAARERRLGALDSLTGRLLKIFPPPAWFARGQRAVAFGDTAEIARLMTAMRETSDDIAQPLLGLVTFTTGDLAAGRRLWRLLTEPSRSLGVRLLAHLTLAKMELMSGRWTAASAEIDSAQAVDFATALEYRALFSLWPLLTVPRSELQDLRARLFRWKGATGPTNDSSFIGEHALAHAYLRLYLLGLVGVRLGESAQALHYATELEQRAKGSFAPFFVEDLARSLRAEVARFRGRPGEALAILDSARFWNLEEVARTGDSPFYDHEYEQFVRAELLDTLGRDEEALRAYRSIADQLFHSGAPAHLKMARIYERQGRRQQAAEHYARFAELWKECDPELQTLVAIARERAR